MTKTTDKAEGRAYRNGYLQAWRDWSGCVSSEGFGVQISNEDLEKLENKRRKIEDRANG